MWYAVANAQQSQKAVALQVRFGFRQYGDFCAFTKRTFSMRPSDVINNPQLAQHNLLKNYPVLVTELIERLESLKQSQNHSPKPQPKTTAQNHSRFFLTNVSEEVRFVLFSFIGEQYLVNNLNSNTYVKTQIIYAAHYRILDRWNCSYFALSITSRSFS